MELACLCSLPARPGLSRVRSGGKVSTQTRLAGWTVSVSSAVVHCNWFFDVLTWFAQSFDLLLLVLFSTHI